MAARHVWQSPSLSTVGAQAGNSESGWPDAGAASSVARGPGPQCERPRWSRWPGSPSSRSAGGAGHVCVRRRRDDGRLHSGRGSGPFGAARRRQPPAAGCPVTLVTVPVPVRVGPRSRTQGDMMILSPSRRTDTRPRLRVSAPVGRTVSGVGDDGHGPVTAQVSAAVPASPVDGHRDGPSVRGNMQKLLSIHSLRLALSTNSDSCLE